MSLVRAHYVTRIKLFEYYTDPKRAQSSRPRGKNSPSTATQWAPLPVHDPYISGSCQQTQDRALPAKVATGQTQSPSHEGADATQVRIVARSSVDLFFAFLEKAELIAFPRNVAPKPLITRAIIQRHARARPKIFNPEFNSQSGKYI